MAAATLATITSPEQIVSGKDPETILVDVIIFAGDQG
jgi:hypothetical protein